MRTSPGSESPIASASTSPARSSHRRLVSTSTIDNSASSRASHEPAPTAPSSASALAKLRESLDADQHAKEAKKVEEVQDKRVRSHEGGKLRKRLPRERVERVVAAEEEEEREEQEPEGGAQDEQVEREEPPEDAAQPLQELRAVEKLVVELDATDDGGLTGWEGGLDAIPPVASQLPPLGPNTAQPSPPAHTLVTLALAPARLGWRAARVPFDVASFAASTSLDLAASTIARGTDVATKTIDTSLQLATNVPVVGLVAAKVARLRESSNADDFADETVSAPTSHVPPLMPPIDHVDTALTASDSAPSSPTTAHHPLETVTKPLSLVRSGVEISLGIGLAGALVAGAVGELAWSALVGGKDPKEGRLAVDGAGAGEAER